MLPKELFDIFQECDEDDFNLYITKVDCSTDKPVIEFILEMQTSEEAHTPPQEWRIVVEDLKKNNLSFDFAESMYLYDDHPLLWEFSDSQCQLYFTGWCNDKPKLFYELYSIHKNIFGEFKSFNISFGVNPKFQLFQFSNGLLSQGPKKLLLKYGECLKQNGMDFTIIGERTATSSDLKILFFGKGFVIARDFVFTRLHTYNS